MQKNDPGFLSGKAGDAGKSKKKKYVSWCSNCYTEESMPWIVHDLTIIYEWKYSHPAVFTDCRQFYY